MFSKDLVSFFQFFKKLLKKTSYSPRSIIDQLMWGGKLENYRKKVDFSNSGETSIVKSRDESRNEISYDFEQKIILIGKEIDEVLEESIKM